MDIESWQHEMSEAITNLVIGPPVVIICLDSISDDREASDILPILPRYPNWSWARRVSEATEKVNWTKEGF